MTTTEASGLAYLVAPAKIELETVASGQKATANLLDEEGAVLSYLGDGSSLAGFGSWKIYGNGSAEKSTTLISFDVPPQPRRSPIYRLEPPQTQSFSPLHPNPLYRPSSVSYGHNQSHSRLVYHFRVPIPRILWYYIIKIGGDALCGSI